MHKFVLEISPLYTWGKTHALKGWQWHLFATELRLEGHTGLHRLTSSAPHYRSPTATRLCSIRCSSWPSPNASLHRDSIYSHLDVSHLSLGSVFTLVTINLLLFFLFFLFFGLGGAIRDTTQSAHCVRIIDYPFGLPKPFNNVPLFLSLTKVRQFITLLLSMVLRLLGWPLELIFRTDLAEACHRSSCKI